jgi:nucleoside-diphosphate-sugar epimerase
MLGHGLDERLFGGGGGLVFVAEGGEEIVKIGLAFRGKHPEGAGGGEAMAEVIARGGGLAGCCLRTGRELRICLIGGDLRCGRHTPRVSPEACGARGLKRRKRLKAIAYILFQNIVTSIETVEQLEDRLTLASEADIAFAGRLRGEVMILGAGGKMGLTLAKRFRRAFDGAGGRRRVLAVSRFQSGDAGREFEKAGIETVSCDLLDSGEVAALPVVENVLFLAGRKFGSSGDPDVTWAMNTLVPANVARHFRDSRIVAFSTGNVYPFVAVESGGCLERDEPAPRGEYAQSCLGRERIFEYYSKQFGTPCLIFRLNYAIDLRYGVLVDIARHVYEGSPVDVSVPAVNVIWQGDANSYAMRSLELCESPPRYLNVTGPETISVRRAAEYFAGRFGRPLHLTGESEELALLSNAGACHAALGYPQVSAAQLMEWVARWIEVGGASLNKATKFQVMDGKF